MNTTSIPLLCAEQNKAGTLDTNGNLASCVWDTNKIATLQACFLKGNSEKTMEWEFGV